MMLKEEENLLFEILAKFYDYIVVISTR